MKTAVKRFQNVIVETLAWKIQHHLCKKIQKVLNIDNSLYVFLEINLSMQSLAIRQADDNDLKEIAKSNLKRPKYVKFPHGGLGIIIRCKFHFIFGSLSLKK
jgi:hypothetical protein